MSVTISVVDKHRERLLMISVNFLKYKQVGLTEMLKQPVLRVSL